MSGDFHVAIRGDGVASRCCAYLLANAGISRKLATGLRKAAPLVMLSDAAVHLMRNVFSKPNLFAGAKRVERRIVSWNSSEPTVMPHGAVIVTGAALADAVHGIAEDGDAGKASDFTVHTEPAFKETFRERFGDRAAISNMVRLKSGEDMAACWVEAVADGWLFLIPTMQGGGWLLSVGGTAQDLLEGSRHLAQRVELVDGPESLFQSAPHMLSTMHGADWLACGSSAIGFDPICGDGTAQAVRQAILAAAVIAEIADGGRPDRLLLHYESMMLAGMRRHLRLCAQFYATGGDSRWWRDQHSALARGFDWCTERLGEMPEPRYALEGFRLVERETVG